MSNIKWKYWMPFLGIAFIRYDHDSQLNTREERTLLMYHTAMGLGIFFLALRSLGQL